MVPDNFKILISRQEIHHIISALAERINHDYQGKRLVLIGVLKGAFVFLADLMRQITVPVEVDFVKLESYGHGTESSSTVKLLKDIDVNICDRDVLIVEEIIDSGRTLLFLHERLAASKPRSLKICALLDKKARRAVTIEGHYVGKDVADKFLIGYGLDYNQAYRNLPEIYVIE